MPPTDSRAEARREARRAARDAQRAAAAPAGTTPEGATGKPPKRKKGPIREWLDAIVFAVVVMFVVRTFFVDNFRIPTPSMEKTLLVGDFLFVSKWHYGVRTPMSISIPFTQIYLPGVRLPSTRFPGFSEVQRGDAVVFNWPDDRQDLPVDKRQHYIKRTVGLPGDTLSIRAGTVYINGRALPEPATFEHVYVVYPRDPSVRVAPQRLLDLGVSEIKQETPEALVVNATEAAIGQVRALPYVGRVERYRAPQRGEPGYQDLVFPRGQGYTQHDFGPVVLPKKGQTVTLTAENWPYLGPTIQRYEGVAAERLPDGTFRVGGQPATSYTFRQDYFFMMGDNRDDSLDSRFWGFVPFDHVVGKAVMVYFHATLAPFSIRPDRIGTRPR